MERIIVFAVVSDGAGSARFGAYGAWLVCRKLKVRFQDWSTKHESLPDDETLVGWIDESQRLHCRNRGTARKRTKTICSYLGGAVHFAGRGGRLHIGDSAIVGRCGSKWKVICWPETGEYASTTYFVTDEPKPVMNIVREPREYDAFALFSDGVGEFALSQLERRPIRDSLNRC